MIVLDLEWNRGYDERPIDEILQIGAVRVDKLGGPITDTYNVYIRPAIHKHFDLGAKKLPDLELSLSSQVAFPEAMADFRAWCAEERRFGCWGGGDLKALRLCCEYYGVPALEEAEEVDLQRAFCRAAGAGNAQIALWKAVRYCQIPDVFSYHNALNDAMYTACLCRWITEEDLREEPVKVKRRWVRFCKLPYERKPRRKIGPLPSAEAVLDHKCSRLPSCPLCGLQGWVTDWYTADGERYFSFFHCRTHGNFPCRLTIARTAQGQWQGRLAVPVLTPAALAEFERAVNGTSHHCASLYRPQVRARWRAKKKRAKRANALAGAEVKNI